MDFEAQAAIEANIITDEQLQDFYAEIEQIPAPRASITGQGTRLLFEYMEDTGGRITETLFTQKKDLNFLTRIWTVTHPKAEQRCKCSTWRYIDMRTRKMVLDTVDKNCPTCKGKGRWKKPQRTTFTPRIVDRLQDYVKDLKDEDYLFDVHRYTVWRWAKEAGKRAGINIFQQKDEKIIYGVFPHLFRALCSKRMIRDAKDNPYRDELLATKRRDAARTGFVADRYTKIDIMYLIRWENQTYRVSAQSLQ